MRKKPPYKLCWNCNRQFQGNHYTKAENDAGFIFVHKACAEQMLRDGIIDRIATESP